MQVLPVRFAQIRRRRRASFPVMTDQTVLTNATDTVARVADSDRPASRSVTTEGDWQVEELTHARLVTGRTGRRTFLLVAALGGLVGLGFAGHFSDPRATAGTTSATPSAPAATLPRSPEAGAELTLTRPQNGDEIVGGSIEVRGRRSVPWAGPRRGDRERDGDRRDRRGRGQGRSTDRDVASASSPVWRRRPRSACRRRPARRLGNCWRAGRSSSARTRPWSSLACPRDKRRSTHGLGLWRGAAWVGVARNQSFLDDRGTVLGAARPTVGAGEGWGGALLSSVPFWASLDVASVAAGTHLHLTITWLDPTSGSAVTVSRLLVGPMSTSALHPG